MKHKLARSEKVVFIAPKKIGYVEEPLRPLKKGEFLVKTLYSAISAGTELTFFNGTNPKSSEGWDLDNRMFRGDLEPSIEDVYPKLGGYMNAAVVIDSKNPDAPIGASVAAMYGHKEGHIMTLHDPWISLPDNMDPILGVWVAHMGPISMNGILYAADEVNRVPVTQLRDSLTGQRIVIFGAGMVGLLCGVFAKWAGAKEVIITDGLQERLDIAKSLGLTPFKSTASLPLDIKRHWTTKDSMDTGADLSIQCTGSDYLLNQAFSCLREQGTVVDLGFYQQGAPELMLGKEFHHNRLRHVCAQIGSVPRHQQALWSKRRLAEETIAFLQEHGHDLKSHLITHQVQFSEAQQIFDKLASRDPSLLQVVLQPDQK